MTLRPWRCLTTVLLCWVAVSFAREPVPEVCALPAAGALEVYFPPWENAQNALLATLDAARSQVLVQAFLLTNRKIADSLITVRRRGVDVRVLADAKQHADNPGSLLDALARAGVPVWLETRYKSAHNKVMVIDAGSAQSVVLTGSFNFTWSAQNVNAENLLIIRGNAALTDRFASNWMRHREDAIPLEPR